MKKRLIVTLMGIVLALGCMTGCTVQKEVKVENTTTETTEETPTKEEEAVVEEEEVADEAEEPAEDEVISESYSYEFDTYDGVHVVIDENNIVSQEEFNEEALANVNAEPIAPGRDYEYLADDDFYYVCDYVNNVLTIATKEDTTVSDGTYSTDDYTIEYNPADFEVFDVRGTFTMTYCNPGVESAGTNSLLISKEEGCTVDEIMDTIVESTNGSKDDVSEGVLGSQEIPTKVYVTSGEASEESGLQLVDTRMLVPCGDDVIVLETIRTVGPNDEDEMTIDGAFLQALESFVLNN